ncbi:hypothetical protein E3E31_08195 [Thermococcus sp. M39]|uniref:hypothetical protein n=1 Tax=Thermococcus sp. M39 TaxID=1638262 RepID=UPI00143A56C4|nr:hypothetical protein [Thermococcus sp. M39]NJE08501.1 hypothetical protein [Thermococcus sp. M39]
MKRYDPHRWDQVLIEERGQIPHSPLKYPSGSSLSQKPVISYPIKVNFADIYKNFFQRDVLITLQQEDKKDKKRVSLPIEKRYDEIKQRLQQIFKENLKEYAIRNITLHTSPEDGEQEIIVQVELHGDNPYEELLKIHRELRKVDRQLARLVTILPAP